MIDTLIFDFDGVIVDTETSNYAAWQDVFESFGLSLDRELWSEVIGGGLKWFDPLKHLESLTGPLPDHEAVRKRRQERHLDMIADSPIMPGVADHLEDARRLGLKLGVASSSSREWVEGHLADRGLLEHFGAVVTRDDVARVKPDPEIYLKAVAMLQSKPANSVAIEDSFNGVASARRAGLLTVAVPNPMTHDMDFQRANLRLDSLADLALESLLDRLHSPRRQP